MKKIMIPAVLMFMLSLAACDNRPKQMDERKDTGIRQERNYEAADNDTTVTDEVNPTGNANSGPVEGP
jgi:hypothetical protein